MPTRSSFAHCITNFNGMLLAQCYLGPKMCPEVFRDHLCSLYTGQKGLPSCVILTTQEQICGGQRMSK